jgi:hypothetical protein
MGDSLHFIDLIKQRTSPPVDTPHYTPLKTPSTHNFTKIYPKITHFTIDNKNRLTTSNTTYTTSIPTYKINP